MYRAFNDYLRLLNDSKYDKEDEFEKMLFKANLEYRLEEYCLSRKTFMESLDLMNFCERNLKAAMALASVLSEWDALFEAIKANEREFLDRAYDDNLINAVKEFYLYKYFNKQLDVKEIFNRFTGKVEQSILGYIASTLTLKDDVQEKIMYCRAALELWNDNLAAAEYLNNCNVDIDLQNTRKLIEFNKFKYNASDNISANSSKSDCDFDMVPLGGGNEVGANSYYMRLDDFHLIIDAGVKINGDSLEYPDFDYITNNNLIEKIDYVIITHAHLDHFGAIIDLYKLNNNLKFLMTYETYRLIKINLKAKGLSSDEEYLLDELSEKIRYLKFGYQFRLANRNVDIKLFRAGHTLGAASILVTKNKFNVFVTGDFCLKDQCTVLGADLPKNIHIDVLVTESTYRDKESLHSNIFNVLSFRKYVLDKLNEGKNVLIPAFAIGRTQEIISIIKSNNGDTGRRIRAYIDGSSIKVTKTYEELLENKFEQNNLFYASSMFYNSKEEFIREEVMNNVSCVICSSGMILNESASSKYAEVMLQDENSACILTGYQAYGTPGEKLAKQIDEEKRYIIINDKYIKIKSEVVSFNLTAHASINDILSVIGYLKPTNVILVHGEYKGIETKLEKKLKNYEDINVIQSINNKKITL